VAHVSMGTLVTNAAFLWGRDLVFTGSKLLVFTISQEVSRHQKHGVRWWKWAWHTKCRLL